MRHQTIDANGLPRTNGAEIHTTTPIKPTGCAKHKITKKKTKKAKQKAKTKK
jgi:hypothetical protein